MNEFVNAINTKQYAKAIELGLQFLAQSPQHARGHYYVGVSFGQERNYEQAIKYCKRAIELGYINAEIYRNLAVIYQDSGDHTNACGYFKLAFALEPTEQVAVGYAQSLLNSKHPERNDIIAQLALQFNDSNYLKLLTARSINIDNKAKGLDAFKARHAENPNDYDIMNEYAIALMEQGQSHIAYDLVKTAYWHNQDNPIFLGNLALIESALGMANQSYRHFRKLIETNDDPVYQSNFGKLLIKMRRYHEGWERNEYRLKTGDLVVNQNPIPLQYWQGEPIKNGALLIIGEQGVGDQINFAVDLQRTIDLLAPHNTRIILTVKPKLERVFRRNFPTITIPNDGLWHEHEHYQQWGATHYCYMGSLMHIHKLFITHKPTPPWITAKQSLMEQGRAVLKQADPNCRWIGLQIKSGIEDNRSINPKDLAPLAELQNHGFRFLSLQYAGSQDMVDKVLYHSGVRMNMIDGADLWDDIEALCGLTMACDSVIMNDTTNAHIAGALGQRGFLILPLESVWRWGFKYKPIEWYPNLTIMREDYRGTFSDLLEQVRDKYLNGY